MTAYKGINCEVCSTPLNHTNILGRWSHGKFVCADCAEQYKKYGRCSSCYSPKAEGDKYYCQECKDEGAFDD